MELIPMPNALKVRNFSGWPEVYRVSAKEEKPPAGISYVIAESVDFALLFRLMVPLLIKQHGYFNWNEIYKHATGGVYYPQRIYRRWSKDDPSGPGYVYGAPGLYDEEVTIAQLGTDQESYVDLDMLTNLAMIPAFMADIRDAITTNVTNNFSWNDGYDKKRGICSGFLTEQPRSRSLVILDISSSIPDGVSAGMLTLIKTITDVVNSDLIVTGSRSFFYTKDEVMDLDINEVRRIVGRSNESDMFHEILRTHDMNYRNVIAFGDSDRPDPVKFLPNLAVDRVYSFFTMERDTYGNYAKEGAGYMRWVEENCPTAVRIDNTDWAKFFNRAGRC